MAKIVFSGPFALRARSFITICAISIATHFRHMIGLRIAPDWDAEIETGIRFWRGQFTKAMRHPDFVRGRLLFDSLLTTTDDVYEVEETPVDVPKGRWLRPQELSAAATILYLHGGGYALHGAVSKRFAEMLAHRTGVALFAPDYRLTPEHPHPAQSKDALAAWRFLTETIPAEDIVVVGDSAGGHMALMLLQTLKSKEMAQPALCIALCPWTDIGLRGESLHGNDRFDLVQGWMALKFGEWLDPDGRFGREALSPIAHDFSGLAPIYLQAGGREILHDMIVDFASVQTALGADVALDVWPNMPHVFQGYDSMTASSAEAVATIAERVQAVGTR